MTGNSTQKYFRAICDELAEQDADLKRIIETHGYPKLGSRPNNYESLVHLILEQQVSLASAMSALNKLRDKIGEITPDNLLALSTESQNKGIRVPLIFYLVLS